MRNFPFFFTKPQPFQNLTSPSDQDWCSAGLVADRDPSVLANRMMQYAQEGVLRRAADPAIPPLEVMQEVGCALWTKKKN
jgi:hypothetical protein